MKKRRVGRISMGVVLIAFGILIFIAQVNNVSAINLSIKFWPIILFLIGGEILWYSYKYREEDIDIRYDVFSIFIVLLIVIMNLGIYGLVETGISSKINSMISSESFTFKLPYKELEFDKNIEKIVIETPQHSNLKLRSEKNDKIVFSGSANITAESKEKAKELLDDEYIISKQSGNILYISFADTSIYNERVNGFSPYDFILSIPGNKKVEVNGQGDNMEIVLDSVNNDWVIDNIGNIKIRLGKSIDARIEASVYNSEILGGNVQWKTTEIKSETEDVDGVKGELTYGDGSNNINIFNSGEVVVNELE